MNRCGPCQRIAPHFEQLPDKYPRAVFLKVDVDKCQDTAAAQGVSAMPTFFFYRNKVKKNNEKLIFPSFYHSSHCRLIQFYHCIDKD